MDDDPDVGFVAIHLGAGYHSKLKAPAYRRLVRHACRLGINLCNDGHTASFIACQVVSLLENSDLSNAGYGSNLTRNEMVQCDAGLMDNRNNFAAVGCIENIRNPIKVAYELLNSQAEEHFGLVPPVLLVGQGARQWAADRGIPIVNNRDLISECALRTYQDNARKMLTQYGVSQACEKEIDRCCEQNLSKQFKVEPQDKKSKGMDGEIELTACHGRKKTSPFHDSLGEPLHNYRKRKNLHIIDNPQLSMGNKMYEGCDKHSDIEDKMDTVGAICVDKYGNVCAAVSSGGLILKQSGRVGQAACYGCGCFVTGKEIHDGHVICASSTSGCGEQLIKTLLAKHCVERLLAGFGKNLESRATPDRCGMDSTCKYSRAMNSEIPACSTEVDGESDSILEDTSCIDSHHTDYVCRNNANRCNKSDVFHDFSDELPKLLDSGFLTSPMLQDLDKKIAGCINIRLIKQFSHISTKTSTNKATMKDSLKHNDNNRCIKYSLDLLVSSTARTFCIGFMRAKDKKPKFLLLEMPDIEQVGRTSVTQEFHLEL